MLDFAKEMVKKILEMTEMLLGIFPIAYTPYLYLPLIDLFHSSESPTMLPWKMSLVHGNENCPLEMQSSYRS